MKKVLGYILSLIGLVILFSSFIPGLKTALFGKIAFLASLQPIYLIIIAAVLLALGIFLVIKSASAERPREVPIYHGEEVVGFRRTEN